MLDGKRRVSLKDTGRLAANILTSVVYANTQKASVKTRKLLEVGLIKLLSKSNVILAPANQACW